MTDGSPATTGGSRETSGRTLESNGGSRETMGGSLETPGPGAPLTEALFAASRALLWLSRTAAKLLSARTISVGEIDRSQQVA